MNFFCVQGAMQGTIPYLGTFLTDLTMLDTALPDQVEVSRVYFPFSCQRNVEETPKQMISCGINLAVPGC